jgi:hypothetical protein
LVAKQVPGTLQLDVIYTHSDGYPSHHGKILLEHYNTDPSVNALLALGDLSILRETPATCVAYMRDRGEKDCEAKRMGIPEFAAYLADSWVVYAYIYKQISGGKWAWFMRPTKNGPSKKLTLALCKE